MVDRPANAEVVWTVFAIVDTVDSTISEWSKPFDVTNTIIDISGKQDVLHGTEDQVVGFDENGNAIPRNPRYTLDALGLPEEDGDSPKELNFGQYNADDLVGKIVITQGGSAVEGLSGTFTVNVSDIVAAGLGGYKYDQSSGTGELGSYVEIDGNVVNLDVRHRDGRHFDSPALTFQSVSFQVGKLKLPTGGGGTGLTPEQAALIAMITEISAQADSNEVDIEALSRVLEAARQNIQTNSNNITTNTTKTNINQQEEVNKIPSIEDIVNKLSSLLPYEEVIKAYFEGSSHGEDEIDTVNIEDGWNKLADVRTPNELTGDDSEVYIQDGLTITGEDTLTGLTSTPLKLIYLAVPATVDNDLEEVLLTIPRTDRTLSQSMIRFSNRQYQINTSQTLTPNWVTLADGSGAITIPADTASGLLLQLEQFPVGSTTPTSIQFVPVIHHGSTIQTCNDVEFNTDGITLDFTSLSFRSDEGYGYKVAEPTTPLHHSQLASLLRDHLTTKWVFGKALLIDTVTEDHVTIVENTNYQNSLQKGGQDVATVIDTEANEQTHTGVRE